MLDAEDFRCLVAGGELTIVDGKDRVKMILQDIGWDLMRDTIAELKFDPVSSYYPKRRRDAR